MYRNSRACVRKMGLERTHQSFSSFRGTHGRTSWTIGFSSTEVYAELTLGGGRAYAPWETLGTGKDAYRITGPGGRSIVRSASFIGTIQEVLRYSS